MKLILVTLALLAGNVAAQNRGPAAQGKKNAKRFRRYGRIVPMDFRGRPQGKTLLMPLDAFTVTEVRYDIKYRYKVVSKRWTITLTGIRCYSVFDRMRSWNRSPGDRELLKHEQGHFDLSEIFALKKEKDLNLRFRNGSMLARGRSKKQALDRLKKKLAVFMKKQMKELPQLHKEYDRVTENGKNAKVQAAESTKHHAQLKMLQKKSSRVNRSRSRSKAPSR